MKDVEFIEDCSSGSDEKTFLVIFKGKKAFLKMSTANSKKLIRQYEWLKNHEDDHICKVIYKEQSKDGFYYVMPYIESSIMSDNNYNISAIFQDIFDMLENKQKEILIRDAFNQINFDTEKDKITIGCPHIEVSIDGRAKWGEELLNAAEAGVHAIIQIEEEEKEEKERQKAERAAKRKSK